MNENAPAPATSQHPSGCLEGRKDVSVSLLAANVYTLLLSPLVALLATPFVLLWGWKSLGHGLTESLDSIWLLPALIMGIFIHEVLHGVGFVYCGRKSWQVVKLGFQWKSLTPYAHCKEPLSVKGYRWSIALPGLILGLLPIMVATGIGSSMLLWWGLLFCWMAGGDAIILWTVRHLKSNSLVIDHPQRAGCYVLSSAKGQADANGQAEA